MSHDWPRFSAYCESIIGDRTLGLDIDFYIVGSTIKIGDLGDVGQAALDSLNYHQLLQLASIQTEMIPRVYLTLVLKSLSAGQTDLLNKGLECGMIPGWWWLESARNWHNRDPEPFHEFANAIASTIDRGAAVVLATRRVPWLASNEVLALIRQPESALAYHTALCSALGTQNAAEVSRCQLAELVEHLDVLLSGPADRTLAGLVAPYNGPDIAKAIAPFGAAAGELTQIALAERYCDSAQYVKALDIIGGIRFLSETFPKAQIIGAVCAIQLGNAALANVFISRVEDSALASQLETAVEQLGKRDH